MQSNKKYIIILLVVFNLTLISQINTVKADWTPDSDELSPINDTYVSIGGLLGDPLANYGLSGSLDIGDGIDGICITAVQFDLDKISFTLSSLEFRSYITVYGDETRTVKVYIFIGIVWDEMSITGIDNPFNVIDLWVAESSEANLTSIMVGGATDEFVVDLNSYKDTNDLITLVFATDSSDDAWITMSSKENEYLGSYSNPPRLVFEKSLDLGNYIYEILGIIVSILGFAGLVIWLQISSSKRKKSRYPVRKPIKITLQTSGYPSNQEFSNKFCMKCGKKIPPNTDFCVQCGHKVKN